MLCCVLDQTSILQLVWLVVIKVIQDLLIGKQLRGFFLIPSRDIGSHSLLLGWRFKIERLL